MPVIYKKPDTFTQVSNPVLQNKNLSWKARGIYAFLVSKATIEGYEFNRKQLIEESEQDGRDSFDLGVQELKRGGVLIIRRGKNSQNQFDYIWQLLTEPVTAFPESGNPDTPVTALPVTGNPEPVNISNTEKNNIKQHKPKETKSSSTKKQKISFNPDTGRLENIPPVLMAKWQETNPALDVLREIAKAEAWLLANPLNRKHNYERFLNGWMSRAQDRAPRRTTGNEPSGQVAEPWRTVTRK